MSMDKPIWYKLEGKTPVPALLTDANFLDFGANNIVCRTEIGQVVVSTVFLRIDHNWGEGPPVLFETMIFGGPSDGHQDRYHTYEEAEEGHRAIVGSIEKANESRMRQMFPHLKLPEINSQEQNGHNDKKIQIEAK